MRVPCWTFRGLSVILSKWWKRHSSLVPNKSQGKSLVLNMLQNSTWEMWQCISNILPPSIWWKLLFCAFLLILCEFRIMHPSSIHLPVPSYPFFTLATSPQNKNHTNKHINKTKYRKYLTVKTIICHNVSLCLSVHTSSLGNVHCNKSLFWFELAGFCNIINSGSCLRYLQVILCHGDPAAMDQQEWPFHVPQQFTEGINFGVGPLKAPNLSLAGKWAGQPTGSPFSTLPGWALQHCSS